MPALFEEWTSRVLDAAGVGVGDRVLDVACGTGVLARAASDRPGAVSEMLRTLVPGGRLAIAVWDSLENSPAYAREVEMLHRMAGSDAADALRAPFVMGDRAALQELVTKAGAIRAESVTPMGRADFPSIRSMVEADLRGWLPVMGVDLEEDLIVAILAEAERELADFVAPDGRMEFDSPAHIVSAMKPE